MKNIILAALVLVSGLACKGTTAIGGADAGCAVTIPQAGFLGPNILYSGNDSFQAQPSGQLKLYELVVTHDATAPVSVNITLLSGTPWALPDSARDWHVTNYDGAIGGTQMFEAPNVTGEFEEAIYFDYTGQARVDLFECGATTPAISKTISWSPPDGGAVFSPDGGRVPLDGGVTPVDASVVVLDGSPPGTLGDDASRPIPLDGGGIVIGPPGERD